MTAVTILRKLQSRTSVEATRTNSRTRIDQTSLNGVRVQNKEAIAEDEAGRTT